MSRSITAMFDSRADAEAAKARLTAAHIDASNISIHDQGTAAANGAAGDHGIWGSVKSAKRLSVS